MADNEAPAATAIAASSKATETLSQFVARVLDQLTLSAWLPSGALVLSVAFLANLRSASGKFGNALGAFGAYSVADGLFLFAALIVLTMVTQAFEFEAIRMLEGYWGPRRLGEWAADITCRSQTWRRERLRSRRAKSDAKAFKAAHFEISRLLLSDSSKTTVTARDLEILLALRETTKTKAPSKAELLHALKSPWQAHAPAHLVRRLENLSVALSHYPVNNRVLPTRLGNLIRSYEDRAFPDLKGETLAGAVQRVHHLLPERVRVLHTQFRTRLDLYCSMVFVVILLTIVAEILLQSLDGFVYSGGVVFIGVVAARLCYRAAVSSADGYGEILLLVGKYEVT